MGVMASSRWRLLSISIIFHCPPRPYPYTEETFIVATPPYVTAGPRGSTATQNLGGARRLRYGKGVGEPEIKCKFLGGRDDFGRMIAVISDHEETSRGRLTAEDVVQFQTVENNVVSGLASLTVGGQMTAAHSPTRPPICDIAGYEAAITEPVPADELDSKFESKAGEVWTHRERVVIHPASRSASIFSGDGLRRGDRRRPGAEHNGLPVRQFKTNTLLARKE